jgi:Fur family transcriptional regulator, peroxide stress response regulator
MAAPRPRTTRRKLAPERRLLGLEEFRQICRQRGLPVTVQRRRVFAAIVGRDDHPTADQIHAALVGQPPEVRRATVFRALEDLVRAGLITKACTPGRAVRYDGRTGLHHHLVCMRCDRVADFFDPRLDRVRLPDTSRQGFQVLDHRVQLRGLCQSCRRKEGKR